MGNTIESDPYFYVRPPEDDPCDEKTKTCGETMSRGKPSDEPKLTPSEAKPTDVAAIARNMAAARTPSEASLRGEYEKMSTDDIEKAVATLTKRLQGGTSYEGFAEDSARFAAAEDVVRQRNVTDPAKGPTSAELTAAKAREDARKQDEEGWRNPFHAQEHGYGIEAQHAYHKGEHLTLFEGSAKLGTAHTGIQGTVMQLQGKHDFGSFDVSGTGVAASAGLDEGTHNADGSVGLHAGGGATAVGGEVTVHKTGVGSLTGGLSAGPSVELSAGLKKEGETVEACGRLGWAFFTVGACVPLGRM